MNLKVYIAGKITGEDPEVCKLKFDAVETKLKMLGVDTVINPLNLGIPISWTWKEARELCLKVLKEKANTIVLLRDWTSSEGALEDYYYARNHGYRIFNENDSEGIVKLVNHSGQGAKTSQYEFP